MAPVEDRMSVEWLESIGSILPRVIEEIREAVAARPSIEPKPHSESDADLAEVDQ